MPVLHEKEDSGVSLIHIAELVIAFAAGTPCGAAAVLWFGRERGRHE